MNIEEIRKQADTLIFASSNEDVQLLARGVVSLCDLIRDLQDTKLDDPEIVIKPEAPNDPKLSHAGTATSANPRLLGKLKA